MNAIIRSGLLACLLATATALAGPAEDFATAEALFQKSLAGDSSSTDPAVERLGKLDLADPAFGPLYQAYLGAAQALQGRDAWMPWNKLSAADKGLATLDKALRRLAPRHNKDMLRGSPVAVEARLVAATTFLALPEMFHRFDDAKDILRAAFASPAFAAAPATVRARLHVQAAIAAARDKKPAEERQQLQQALAVQADRPIAASARKRLQELGS
jgi:hypothetical protein